MTQNEDINLGQIQAGNQQVRKKLQNFRSGLQKMMNKKNKKVMKNQPPSHDVKSPINSNKNQYSSINSGTQKSQSPKTNLKLKQSNFGYNSTLFKQLGNDSVVISDSSGILGLGRGSSPSNYNSVSTNNYYSTQSKDSNNNYGYKQQINEGQSFKKSMKLFSQIDQLMNKVNKTSKLPVKPIQKYFQKNQSKRTSNLSQFELENISITKNSLYNNIQKNYYSNSSNNQEYQYQSNKNKIIQDIEEKKKSINKNKSKNDKYQKIQINIPKDNKFFMKSPPLPPMNQTWFPQKNKKTDHLNEKNSMIKTNLHEQIKKKQTFNKKEQLQKIRSVSSTEMHKNKLQQTLNQRKMIINKQDILNDSIDLQLSDQQENKQNQTIIQKDQYQQDKAQQINLLMQQKNRLLKELQQVQQELQTLQNSIQEDY